MSTAASAANVPTSATLSMTQLKEILAGGRTTTYKPTLIAFAKSNQTYQDVMQLIEFADKKIDSVFNSMNNNLKTLKAENPQWPHIEVKKVDGCVYLINVTALQGNTSTED